MNKKTWHHQPRFVLLKRIGKVHVHHEAYAHTVSPEQLRDITRYLTNDYLI